MMSRSCSMSQRSIRSTWQRKDGSLKEPGGHYCWIRLGLILWKIDFRIVEDMVWQLIQFMFLSRNSYEIERHTITSLVRAISRFRHSYLNHIFVHHVPINKIKTRHWSSLTMTFGQLLDKTWLIRQAKRRDTTIKSVNYVTDHLEVEKRYT